MNSLLAIISTCELNGVKTMYETVKNFSDAVLLTTDHMNIKKYRDLNKFNLLLDKVKLYRNWGDCYGYYLVATGLCRYNDRSYYEYLGILWL